MQQLPNATVRLSGEVLVCKRMPLRSDEQGIHKAFEFKETSAI